MAAKVDSDHPELVRQAAGQWVEETGTESVGVQNYQWDRMCWSPTPVEKTDPESVAQYVPLGRSTFLAPSAHAVRSPTNGVWLSASVRDDTERREDGMARGFGYQFTALALTAVCALTPACGDARPGVIEEPGGPTVRHLVPRVVSELPHDPEAFTQGLELIGGRLLESTGLYGSSTIRLVDRVSGTVLQSRDLDDQLFGEGITALSNGRAVQLTWKAGRALIWDLSSLSPVEDWSYEGEGWGVCLLDEGVLATSDGSSAITLRRTEDFSVVGSVRVVLGGEPVDRLNELECVGSTIWANVWLTDQIVAFDVTDGRVVMVVDASGLPIDRSVLGPDAVLNGIAHDPESGRFLLTGKRWPWLFEVELVDAVNNG